MLMPILQLASLHYLTMQLLVDEHKSPLTYEDYIINYQRRIKLRKSNFQKQQKAQLFQAKQKTAVIKTIQKFISKLKLENKNFQSILLEMDSLNLNKYTEEISNIIVNSLTDKQIPFYAQVATKLNEQYENFPAIIIDHLKRTFQGCFQSDEDNKNKMKAILLFACQLFVCGFAFSYKQIIEMIKKVFKSGNKKKTTLTTQTERKLFAFYYNCETFSTFLVNFGQIFTKSKSKWIIEWQQNKKQIKPYPGMIPASVKDQLTKFFQKYILECVLVLQQVVDRMNQYQIELKDNLRMQGQFNKQTQKKYLHILSKFNCTKENLRIMAESLSEPIQKNQKIDKTISLPNDLMKAYVNTDNSAQLFQNQFQRQIYEGLPDLVKSEGKASETDYKQFKQRLDSCKNTHDSEQIAKFFENYNNKKNRRLLIKDILEYRKEYQLVTPYLCRVAAIINRNWKDIGQGINQQLFSEYDKLKDTTNGSYVNNDKKNRNWKYLCEFIKFDMIEPQKIICRMHNLVDDLKGHNIELLITSLQSIGRYLYLLPSSANKFTFLLSKLDNVLKQKSFPLMITSRLTNVITTIKPQPEVSAKPSKIESKQQKQAKQILSLDMITSQEQIINRFRKFCQICQGNVQIMNSELMEKIQSFDFIGNYNFAYLLNELNIQRVNQFIVNQTIKRLLDSIQAFNYQKSIILSRFFAQLFKYELMKRSFLYINLEKIIKMEANQLGVINSICTILETCIGYLNSKRVTAENQKFKFLCQFKKYIQNCRYIPMIQQFKILDIFEVYQPNLMTIKLQYLDEFLLVNEGKKDKESKDINLSVQFDRYLDKKALKKNKKQIVEQKDERMNPNKQVFLDKQEEEISKRNNQILKVQSKFFQNQFKNTLNTNIKDFSGRIAKQTFIQKTIQKRNQKKRPEEAQSQKKKIITVIGRSGNKFIKKDVCFKDQNNVKEELNNGESQSKPIQKIRFQLSDKKDQK